MVWLGLAGLGAVGGLFLGHFAVGAESAAASGYTSYADVTGNPQALAVDAVPVEDCFGCFDSYGAAMRMRAMREQRMEGEFRELGAVAIDYAAEPAGDYDYGGSFDDPAAATTLAMQSPVPLAAATQPSVPVTPQPRVPVEAVDPKIVMLAVEAATLPVPATGDTPAQ